MRRRSRPSSSGEDRPLQQESELAFAQRKLEENYCSLYGLLDPRRSVIQACQEVLVWKRPVLAVALYLAVHSVFYHFATTKEGFLTQLSFLLFWLLVGDAIWRAATRDGQGLGANDPHSNNPSSRSRARREGTRRRQMGGVVAFERALLLSNEERSCQQLVPFEVVCLTLAQLWMWIDYILLALRHWSINDPLMFSLSLAVPGLVLAVVGHYISTIVLLYVLVMGMIVWPYVSYHDLIQKTSTLISTHFPILVQKAVAFWLFLKQLMARDEQALTEFSLVSEGDDIETRQMLGNELDLFMGQPQGEREGGRREEEEGGEGENREGGEQGGERRRVKIRRPVRRVDPGMSVLQDSVLGMPPDAFHDVEDSLASFGPGTGDFPSISNFDQDHSLMLPQFPPDDETDHHATPSIPPNLHTIQESEEDSADDLSPLEDPAELEHGLNSEIISRHQSATRRDSTPTQQQTTRPHPPAQYSTSAPITSYQDYPSLQGQLHQEGEGGHRTPPPPYEDVVSSPDIQAGSYGFVPQSRLDKEVRHRGVPRNSSTPSLNGQQ